LSRSASAKSSTAAGAGPCRSGMTPSCAVMVFLLDGPYSNVVSRERGVQGRHDVAHEQLHGGERFFERHVAERELSDAIVHVGFPKLALQRRRHGRRAASDPTA